MAMRWFGYSLFILMIASRFICDAWLGTYTLKDFRGVSRQDVAEAFSGFDTLYEFITNLLEFCENGLSD